MLPFMQPKKLASSIIAHRLVKGTAAPDEHEGEHAPELMQHAESLISAVHAKDAHSVASAMKAAHEHMSKAHPHIADSKEE